MGKSRAGVPRVALPMRYSGAMFHHVMRALPGRLLFADPVEAHALWVRVVAATPGVTALCLMPNHVHVLHRRDLHVELGHALSGFVRWRHARRGTGGRWLAASPRPDRVEDSNQKILRQIRYIHLNPCRARLVSDPVAWPLSTHLDALGLAHRPAIPRVSDPHAFHAYVSGDPSVRVGGSDLPVAPGAPLSLGQVLVGISAATRMPAEQLLSARSAERSLVIAVARGWTSATNGEIASTFGISRSTVQRTPACRDARLAALCADDRVRGWERGVSSTRRRPRHSRWHG